MQKNSMPVLILLVLFVCITSIQAMEGPETSGYKQVVVERPEEQPECGDICRFSGKNRKGEINCVDIMAEQLFSLGDMFEEPGTTKAGKVLKYRLDASAESMDLLKQITSPKNFSAQDLFAQRSLRTVIDALNIVIELNIFEQKINQYDTIGMVFCNFIASQIAEVTKGVCRIIEQACGDFVNNNQPEYYHEKTEKSLQNLCLMAYYNLLARLHEDTQKQIFQCFVRNGVFFGCKEQVAILSAEQFSSQNLEKSKNNFSVETSTEKSQVLLKHTEELKKLTPITFLQKIENLAKNMMQERKIRDQQRIQNGRLVIRSPHDVLSERNKRQMKGFGAGARMATSSKDTFLIVYNEKLDIEIQVSNLFVDPTESDIEKNVSEIQKKYNYWCPHQSKEIDLLIPCTMSSKGLNTLSSILIAADNSRLSNQGKDDGYENRIKQHIGRLELEDIKKMKELFDDLGINVQYRANGQLKSVKDLLVSRLVSLQKLLPKPVVDVKELLKTYELPVVNVNSISQKLLGQNQWLLYDKTTGNGIVVEPDLFVMCGGIQDASTIDVKNGEFELNLLNMIAQRSPDKVADKKHICFNNEDVTKRAIPYDLSVDAITILVNLLRHAKESRLFEDAVGTQNSRYWYASIPSFEIMYSLISTLSLYELMQGINLFNDLGVDSIYYSNLGQTKNHVKTMLTNAIGVIVRNDVTHLFNLAEKLLWDEQVQMKEIDKQLADINNKRSDYTEMEYAKNTEDLSKVNFYNCFDPLQKIQDTLCEQNLVKESSNLNKVIDECKKEGTYHRLIVAIMNYVSTIKHERVNNHDNKPFLKKNATGVSNKAGEKVSSTPSKKSGVPWWTVAAILVVGGGFYAFYKYYMQQK